MLLLSLSWLRSHAILVAWRMNRMPQLASPTPITGERLQEKNQGPVTGGVRSGSKEAKDQIATRLPSPSLQNRKIICILPTSPDLVSLRGNPDMEVLCNYRKPSGWMQRLSKLGGLREPQNSLVHSLTPEKN